MFRLLLFLVVVFALGLGFAWLAERPGEIVLTFGGYRYQLSLLAAAVLVAAIVAAVMLLWWVIRGIWTSPYAVARYFRVRRRDRGYQALSTGMIAAGAGDGGLAQRMGKQAAKLIDSDREPLVHLLDAQAALLEGDHDTARARFEAMLDDPEMRLLGLRGLYLEAERLGERDAARHYAEQAAETAPQLAWAANAALEVRTLEGDWDGALKLLDARKTARHVKRDEVNRKRAVVLTAQAMDLMDPDPAAARTAATEANRLQPDFVPAALAAARAHFRNNDLRRGSKILEASWKKEPHPQVADLYVHARPGDAPHDRLERARKLRSLRQNNVESSLAVARAALDAGEYREARTCAETAIRLSPREGAYLLLADIEEAETGDQGRVRQWLARAVRAPADPAWVADGYVSDRWAPYSPVTGRLDAFEWRVPMERLAQIVESGETEGESPEPPALTVMGAEDETAEIVDAPTVAPPKEEPAPAPKAEKAKASPPPEDDRIPEKAEAAPASSPEPAPAPEPAQNATRRNGNGAGEEDATPSRPPDDPGVDTDDGEKQAARRFRLF